MASKRPLAERVWWDEPRTIGWYCQGRLGHIGFTLYRYDKPKRYWWLACETLDLHHHIETKTLSAAKAEALRIVQRAVLEAAQAWSDT